MPPNRTKRWTRSAPSQSISNPRPANSARHFPENFKWPHIGHDVLWTPALGVSFIGPPTVIHAAVIIRDPVTATTSARPSSSFCVVCWTILGERTPMLPLVDILEHLPRLHWNCPCLCLELTWLFCSTNATAQYKCTARHTTDPLSWVCPASVPAQIRRPSSAATLIKKADSAAQQCFYQERRLWKFYHRKRGVLIAIPDQW